MAKVGSSDILRMTQATSGSTSFAVCLAANKMAPGSWLAEWKKKCEFVQEWSVLQETAFSETDL